METCNQCGEILKGRSHRKFCSDQCRAAFHNAIHQEEWKQLRSFARTVYGNAKKLLELKGHKTQFSLAQLQALGINPYCCMEWRPTQRGVGLRYAEVWLYTTDGWNFSFTE